MSNYNCPDWISRRELRIPAFPSQPTLTARHSDVTLKLLCRLNKSPLGSIRLMLWQASTYVPYIQGDCVMDKDKDQKAFRVTVALICEDVRREISGKEILIGVFADSVFITFVPFPLVLTLYMRAMVPDGESYIVHFRVLGPGDAQVTPVVSATLGKAIDPTTSVSIILGGIAFQSTILRQIHFSVAAARS